MLLAGYGSAFVDIVINVSDAELMRAAPKVMRGTVCPVSKHEQQQLLAQFAPERHHRSIGGSCANTLRHFALEAQEHPSATQCAARLIAPIGSDDNAEFFTAQIARIPNLEFCPIAVKDTATNCCVAIVTPDGERTMFPMLEAEQQVRPELLLEEYFKDAQWLHIEGYTLRYPAIWAHLTQFAERTKLPYSVDAADYSIVTAHRAELLASSPAFKWLFANEAEANALRGNDLAHWPQARAAIVTLGARGACALCNHTTYASPSIAGIKVVDTVGAGDSFIAGFLHAWLAQNCDADDAIVTALHAGCSCAAQCIQHVGA